MELENLTTDSRQLSRFDVDDIGIEALLFQTGYLTITAEERRGPRTLYTLDYPNFEVRQSLNDGLLGYIADRREETADQGDELGRLLTANDFDGFADRLRSFFAGLPYQWQTGNGPARYEAWYAGMLYACFRTIGLDLRVEDFLRPGPGGHGGAPRWPGVRVSSSRWPMGRMTASRQPGRQSNRYGKRVTRRNTGIGASRCTLWASHSTGRTGIWRR